MEHSSHNQARCSVFCISAQKGRKEKRAHLDQKCVCVFCKTLSPGEGSESSWQLAVQAVNTVNCSLRV